MLDRVLGAERRSAGLARSAPRALRHDTPCPNTRRQKRALRATRQTPTIPDKTHQHHPCSSVVSVSIRGLFRRVTISAPTRVLFLAHVTRQGAFHRPLRASGRPNSPFSPCGRRGQGDEGQRRENAANCVLLLRTLPLSGAGVSPASSRVHRRRRERDALAPWQTA